MVMLTLLPPPAGEDTPRQQAIRDIAREFLSHGATPAELRMFASLSPFGAVADAMAELAGA